MLPGRPSDPVRPPRADEIRLPRSPNPTVGRARGPIWLPILLVPLFPGVPQVNGGMGCWFRSWGVSARLAMVFPLLSFSMNSTTRTLNHCPQLVVWK